MLPIFIGGVISGIGSVVGGLLGYKGQKKTNEANTALGMKQMEFQERMVNQAQDFEAHQTSTAYQRAMADMEAAGLNPILAYQQGGAASAIGKTAPGSLPVMQNPAGSAAGALSAVASSSRDIASADTPAVERERIRKETLVWGEREGLTNQQIHKVQTEMDHIRKMINKVQAETAGIEADNVQREVIADFLQSAEFFGIAKYIGVSPQALGGLVRMLFMRGK